MYAVVGIPCDIKPVGKHPFYAAGVKYVAAGYWRRPLFAAAAAGAGGQLHAGGGADQFDGVLLTGSFVQCRAAALRWRSQPPRHAARPGARRHHAAADWRVIARGMPLAGHLPGFSRDQRRLGRHAASACRNKPAWPTTGFIRRRAAGGQLRAGAPGAAAPRQPAGPGAGRGRDPGELTASARRGHPGPRPRAEAHAPDGLIEAFSLPDAPGWLHAVQWHPEWQYAHNPASLALFTAFGEACRQYRQARTGQPALPTPQGEAR